MNAPCDCCQGVHIATPAALFNRPGLGQLDYRVGTYGTFLESMQARLSGPDFPALADLKTREPSDAAMAFIDAWSVVGDVLTFYQERIANEGYLRTATEFRSVLELARLVGYTPRPGVAASVHLAYMLDDGAAPVVIPKGARSNTIPGPGEQMQAFETSEPLLARREWNMLGPRMTRPLLKAPRAGSFYLKGILTGLQPNDPLIIGDAASSAPDKWKLEFVCAVEPEAAQDRTRITLRAPMDVEERLRSHRIHRETSAEPEFEARQNLIGALVVQPAISPANAQRLPRSAETALAPNADTVPRLLAASRPVLAGTLFEAWRNVAPATRPQIEVYVLRITAAPFGYNAPLRQALAPGDQKTIVTSEWDIGMPWIGADASSPHHKEHELFLDNDYDLAPHTFIAIQKVDMQPIIVTPRAMQHLSLAAYGLSGKTVQIVLPDEESWLDLQRDKFQVIRSTIVYTGSEKLELAEVPIENGIGECELELDRLYDGLEPGRWVIVSGERNGDAKVHATEIAMIAAVRHDVQRADLQPLPGETAHTYITLAECLAYSYRRDSVTIYGNVVKATHGETRAETLGAGDATKAFQTFELKQPPLTFVSAPTPSGIESTLQVRVNDVLWHEADSMAALGTGDRKYITRADDGGRTRIVFGDGAHGERLPTGLENLKAAYRSGIGKAGNAKAGQIALLNTRPLGVKDVINPARASGGAGRETLSQARRNAPLALLALDRLVSTKDYADFTRTFAGIGKAAACRENSGAVKVTIAGVDDIPIDANSDLYRNLLDTLHRFGDPHLRVVLGVRKRASLVVSARVNIDPDYLWEKVEPKIRAVLLDRFGFEQMDIGEAALLSDALAAIQSVEGVLYSDIDVFDTISDDALLAQFVDGTPISLCRRDVVQVAGDSIAYLTPDVADTLILQEATS